MFIAISSDPCHNWSCRARRVALRIGAVAVVLAVTRPNVVLAQPALPLQAEPAAWRVRSVGSSDLWFHGMAVIGVDGPGPLPMYDREYAQRVRDAKHRRGIYPTLLDRKAADLRNAFHRDSTFEVLHFLPLYFLLLDADALLGAVRALVRQDSRAIKALDPATRNAVTALDSVLTTRRARDVLGEFIEPQLIGVAHADTFAFGNDPKIPKTIGNYWPYATTLYDYIHRAMPYGAPGSLRPREVYSVVAFLLAENQVIPREAVIDAKTLPKVRMPARSRFVPDDRKGGASFR